MEIIYGKGETTVKCGLEISKTLRIVGEVPAELEPDVIAYAVARFLRHGNAPANDYAWQSYQIRLASGRGRKVRRCYFIAPAALMQLPGEWVRADVSISAAGVSVDRVGFYYDFEDAQYARTYVFSHGGRTARGRNSA